MRGFFRLTDQVFDPTLAFIGFSEDLLLSYAMITPLLAVAYVDPFAHSWLGLSTSDLSIFLIIEYLSPLNRPLSAYHIKCRNSRDNLPVDLDS